MIDGEQNERILGSGIGGGTFMGLGRLLGNKDDYEDLVSLASVGNKGNVDLLVKDIYHPEESPIDGNLTASNFAKAAIGTEPANIDRLAAIVNMMSETIVLLSKQATEIYNVTDVVYIGSTLIGNAPFKSSLERFSIMFGLTPHFLQDGEYSGAIGAILVT